MSKILLLFYLLSASVACTSGHKLKAMPMKTVNLQLNPQPGTSETQVFSYMSEVDYFEDQQLLKEKMQGVDFEMLSKFLSFDSEKQTYKVRISTESKVGTMSLNSMGYPELSEVIVYEFSKNLNVIHVDRFRKGSVFYVPPTPLPVGDVEVGDTWTIKHSWLGENNLPLTMNLVGILKQVYNCPGHGACAEIEVSGQVRISAAIKTNLKIQSNIRGKFLIENKTASVLWSHVRSEELFVSEENRIKSLSCMVSVRQKPKVLCFDFPTDRISCDPKNEVLSMRQLSVKAQPK